MSNIRKGNTSKLEELITNNLQKILKVKKIDYKKFAKIMKWDNAYAHKIIKGRRNITLYNLDNITKELGLDIRILLHPSLKAKREFQITIKGAEVT
jgi:transcriptional regulator with XRE-family HTH domain